MQVEQVKRENKLWSSDQLFLRDYLFIPRTQDNSQGIPEDCIVTGTEMSQTQKAHESHSREQRSDSVKSNTSITSDGVTISSDVSAKDFLSKYDFDIAKIKSNVKKMEQNAR